MNKAPHGFVITLLLTVPLACSQSRAPSSPVFTTSATPAAHHELRAYTHMTSISTTSHAAYRTFRVVGLP